MKDSKEIWFPAKKNGWGWGAPNCLQGWIVLAVYFALFATMTSFINPKEEMFRWFIFTVTLTAGLFVVIRFKGEAPNWKWKKIEKEKRSLFRFEKSVDATEEQGDSDSEKKSS